MMFNDNIKRPRASLGAGSGDAAAQWILQELIDALIQEDLFGLQRKSVLDDAANAYSAIEDFTLVNGEYYLRYPLAGDAGELVWRVRKQQFIQPYRLSRAPVLHIESGRSQVLDAGELMNRLVASADSELLPDISGIDRFMHDLSLAEAQASFAFESADSIAAAIDGGEPSLALWERLAALRDRPFHPLARAKSGWTTEDCRSYGTELGCTFGLDWIAVRNQFLSGEQSLRGLSIAQLVLKQNELDLISDSLAARDLDPAHYTAMPVHPWQMRHVVVKEFAGELARGDCAVIAESLGAFTATSSIRSLVPVQEHRENEGESRPHIHIKVPVAIAALGAQRILPPRYLHNGASAQAVLQAIFEREPHLSALTYCDETQWLGFSPDGESMLSNRSGHLTCLVRQYPITGGDGEWMPMSALSVIHEGKVPALEWIAKNQVRESKSRQELALRLFEQLCQRLTALSFTCFGYGVMPEVHGQNVVLSFKGGEIDKLVLRDHDTLRLLPPWMRQAGINDADYIMDWATPNSLICLSPQELLRYFQTLGVQVNLYAIADALGKAYEVEISAFWGILRRSFQEQLQALNIPIFAKAILRKELLDNPVWPTRLLLTPYLVHRSRKTGMPSGTGSTRNPMLSEVL